MAGVQVRSSHLFIIINIVFILSIVAALISIVIAILNIQTKHLISMFRQAAGQFGPIECLAKHDMDFEEEKTKNPELTSSQFSRMVAERFRNDPEIFPVLMSDDIAR